MVAYFSSLIGAALVATASYILRWWVPIIAFPLCILILPNRYAYRHPSPYVSIQTMRWVFYLLCATYVTSQTLIFQVHLRSWYGWLVGLALSWIGAGMIAAKLDDRLRWRELR